MFYRVVLDCRPTKANASQPFVTVKFVEADTESAAMLIASARTKALMKERGFEDPEIASYEFAAEEIERVDPEDAELRAERSFAYYSDD